MRGKGHASPFPGVPLSDPSFDYQYLRLVAKEKLPSGKYKKIYEKEAQTPYQRLLQSAHVSEGCKAELRRRAVLLNPVVLKRQMDEAGERILKLSVIPSTFASGKVS